MKVSLAPIHTLDGGLDPQAVQLNFDKLAQALNQLGIYWGNGTPENNVTAPKGSLYRRFDGGGASTFYVKESGAGSSGWTPK